MTNTMKTIYTYDNPNNNEQIMTLSSNSGLFLASDPFNYTMSNSYGLVLSGNLYVMSDIRALDYLSDEIGITHEAVEGEVVGNGIDD